MSAAPGQMPHYAYVPGRTPRHPEGAFEPIRATAEPDPMASQALRTGLDWIDAGYFWEAHEVLEPVWMALPDGPHRRGVQALIQLANAGLKVRMGRPAAALRLIGIARGLAQGQDLAMLGLVPAPNWLESQAKAILAGLPDMEKYAL